MSNTSSPTQTPHPSIGIFLSCPGVRHYTAAIRDHPVTRQVAGVLNFLRPHPFLCFATLCLSSLYYPYHNRGIKRIKRSYAADVRGTLTPLLKPGPVNECKGSLKSLRRPASLGWTDESRGQKTIKPENLIPVAEVLKQGSEEPLDRLTARQEKRHRLTGGLNRFPPHLASQQNASHIQR